MLAAVSGGPDSVACLWLLHGLRGRFGFEVLAAHFDHQLRPESRSDLEYVRELCGWLDVPCFTGEGDVRRAAREQRAGIEDMARRMRYQFLAFVAGKEQADCIATGHTFDDQAETVLMRIVRGSGVRGIRGMLPSSGVPGAEAQRLVRPLLVLRREETVSICAEAGITPRSDLSNVDLSHFRNRVRAEILPALRSVNPSVDEALVGLAASAREAFADVERQSLGAKPEVRGPAGAIFELSALLALPAEALTLVVEREAAFYQLRPEVNRTLIENLQRVLASGSGSVRFGEVVVQASCGKVRIGPEVVEPATFDTKVLNVPGVTVFGPWRIEVTTEPPAPVEGVDILPVATAKLRGALRARPLQPGDRMTYHGFMRKVQDLLTNAKVPLWERAGVVVITDGASVVGLGGPVAFADDPRGAEALYIRAVRATP